MQFLKYATVNPFPNTRPFPLPQDQSMTFQEDKKIPPFSYYSSLVPPPAPYSTYTDSILSPTIFITQRVSRMTIFHTILPLAHFGLVFCMCRTFGNQQSFRVCANAHLLKNIKNIYPRKRYTFTSDALNI